MNFQIFWKEVKEDRRRKGKALRMRDIIRRIQGMWLMFDLEYNVFGCITLYLSQNQWDILLL